MSDDGRRTFIVNCIKNLCTDFVATKDVLATDVAVDRFLADCSCALLQVQIVRQAPEQDSNESKNSDLSLVCSNEINESTNWTSACQSEIHFVKLVAEALSEENMSSNVQVTSMLQSPIHSLYHAMKTLYGPMLLQENGTWSNQLSHQVKELVTNLQAGLGYTVKAGDVPVTTNHDLKSREELRLLSILSPVDEFDYWDSGNPGESRGDRERARVFSNVFDAIAHRYGNLSHLALEDMHELVEDTYNVCDDLWRAPSVSRGYPEPRMRHFFSVISQAIVLYCTKHAFGKISVWSDAFPHVKSVLSSVLKMGERWLGHTEEATGVFWCAHEDHVWTGPKYSDPILPPFLERIEEVLRLRTTAEELLALLSPEEQAEFINASSHHSKNNNDDEEKEQNLGVHHQIFQSFQNVSVFNVNPYATKQWHKALEEFETIFEPIELRIGSNLQKQFQHLKSQPIAALRQLNRYRHLIHRPVIGKCILGERETLLAQLCSNIEHFDREFEHQSSAASLSSSMKGKNLSPRINAVLWARQLIGRVDSIQQGARGVLSSFSRYATFCTDVGHFRIKLDDFITEQIHAWQDEVQELLEDGEISLEMTGRLMHIDVDGNLIVNFSERLVTLLREVRQLLELGTAMQKKYVPKNIQQVAQEAEQYYRYGITLQKVANYYNTMEDQIIDVQKPLLLNSLLAFEQVVQNPSSSKDSTSSSQGKKMVTWNNPEECEEYVVRLQQSCEQLANENRKLRRVHGQLGDFVIALMDIDLLRQREKWKAKWNEMKSLMKSFERKYPSKHLLKWQIHWDHQLYKALECNYQIGLESLNENLPEIKSELQWNAYQRELVFQPPIEELQAFYYKEMKKFISIPTAFQGLSGSKGGELFNRMSQSANVSSLVRVYEKGELMFTKLLGVCQEYQKYFKLGLVNDMDGFIEETVNQVGDWELNFQVLRQKRKECDKLPDFVRLDCFHISMMSCKSSLDDVYQRCQDALLLHLRQSIFQHLTKMDEFLTSAMDQLNTRPQNIEEISTAKQEWKRMESQKPLIQQEYKLCKKKRTLFLNVVGGNIDTTELNHRVEEIPSRWETFEIAFEAFNEMIEEQREHLKDQMESEIMECNMNLDKFSQRWHALKPTEIAEWTPEALSELFQTLLDWKEQFQEIKEATERLITNCGIFQMPSPQFDGLEALEVDIVDIETNWNMYRDFQSEQQVFADQDWITFRSKIYDLQDFGSKWTDEIKGKERNPVAQKILSIVNSLRRALPTLKFCRGEPFKEEHWTQLFRKLGMPKGVKLENLRVAHFLDVLTVLEEPASLTFVKVLQARAQGEVTIREALQELRAWTQTAEISLLEHEENGRSTCIIKDWKDLTLELGDNQSLLASLKESQFFKPFADQAQQYEQKMAALDKYLSQLQIIQRKWVYLEPIFGRGALPSEQGRFQRVDQEFRDIMDRVQTEPKLFYLADELMFPQISDRLDVMVDQLERCQKALADYLEEKRSRMPRFYFIGDDDLVRTYSMAVAG